MARAAKGWLAGTTQRAFSEGKASIVTPGASGGNMATPRSQCRIATRSNTSGEEAVRSDKSTPGQASRNRDSTGGRPWNDGATEAAMRILLHAVGQAEPRRRQP